jgi:uncharacterized protein
VVRHSGALQQICAIWDESSAKALLYGLKRMPITIALMRRPLSRAVLAAFLLAPAAALLGGCGPGAAAQPDAGTAAAPELKWEELIPKSWDPTKRYRNISLEALRDNDPRAIQMLDEMRAVWDNAPVNVDLDGKPGKLAGFVVPLDNTQEGIREFLLVPYFGACIHTPPPPANQIVHVVAACDGHRVRQRHDEGRSLLVG